MTIVALFSTLPCCLHIIKMLEREIAYDKPNRHSQQFQLRRLSGRQRWGPWALNRTPVAPAWRRGRSLEKAAKNEGGPCWASSEERVNYEAAPPRQLTVDSPMLRMGGGKSGVGGGE